MAKNKTEYTPTEALKCLENISKNAFYEDMANGRISYDERPWGKKKRRFIQGAELARAYSENFKPQRLSGTSQQNETVRPSTSQQNIKTTHKNIDLAVEVEVLRERIKDKEGIISDKNEIISELREDVKDWKTQAKTLLLRKPDSKEEEQGANKSPQRSTQGIISNSNGKVGGKPEKAIRGENFAAYGSFLLLILVFCLLGVVFWPDIQTRLNEAGLNNLTPIARKVVE